MKANPKYERMLDLDRLSDQLENKRMELLQELVDTEIKLREAKAELKELEEME